MGARAEDFETIEMIEKHNIQKTKLFTKGVFPNCLSSRMGARAEDSETDLLPLLRLGICHWETEKSENWNKENIEK